MSKAKLAAARYLLRAFLLSLLLLLANCRPTETAALPTLAVLPSLTFTPVPTATLTLPPTNTVTFTPSHTWTPDLVETRRAELEASNAAGQFTLAALWTSMAPTFTPTVTRTPSLTITMTRTPLPSLTPRPTATPTARLRVLQPRIYYVRSTANIRTCPRRDCTQIGQLLYGSPIMVTGSVEGDEINAGNGLWYQVNYLNDHAYIYSALLSLTLPTAVPPTQPPIYVPPLSTLPPLYSTSVYSPPVDSGGSCPSTCSGMSSCAQAYACMSGNGGLDRDNDGVPCESICPGG